MTKQKQLLIKIETGYINEIDMKCDTSCQFYYEDIVNFQYSNYQKCILFNVLLNNRNRCKECVETFDDILR